MDKACLLDELDDFVYVVDMENYNLLYLNKRCREIIPLTEDYNERKCYEVLQGRDAPCTFCTNSVICEDKFNTWQYNNNYLGRNFIVKDKVIRWEGKKARLVLSMDITQGVMPLITEDIAKAREVIMNQQRKLNYQQSYFNHMYSSIPCGVAQFTMGKEPKLLHYNDSCIKIFGYSGREEFENAVKEDLCRVVYPGDIDFFSRMLEKVNQIGKRADYELRILRGDGTVGYISEMMEAVTNHIGEKVIQVTFLDITGEREKEIKITALAQTLPVALAIFEVTDQVRLTYISEGWKKLTGYDINECKNEKWLGHREEDYLSLLERMKEAVRKREGFEAEYPFTRRDGSLIWMNQKSVLVSQNDNKLVYYGVYTDVTQLKNSQLEADMQRVKYELEVEKSKKQNIFLKNLFETVPCGILHMSFYNGLKIYSANRAAKVIFGCDWEEDSLQSLKKVYYEYVFTKYNQYRDEIYQRIWEKGETVEYEYQIKRRDGKRRWITGSAKKVYSIIENRAVVQCVFFDNTEQKELVIQTQKQYSSELQYFTAISKDVLSTARINITKNIVEEYQPNHLPMKDYGSRPVPYDILHQDILSYVIGEQECCLVKEKFSRQAIMDAFEKGIEEVELDYRRKNGQHSFQWVRTGIKLTREPETGDIIGFGVVRDIDRDKTELSNSRRLLRHMQIVSSERYYFVMALDYEKNTYDVIQCNARNRKEIPLCGSITDLTRAMYSFYGTDYYEIIDALASEEILLSKFSNGSREWVYEGRAQNFGIFKWYEHSVIQVADTEAQRNIYLFSTTDIDVRKAKEEELKKALSQAEKAGNAKREFLSHMSHEIRTPLNGIKGMLDLMKDQEQGMDKKLLDNAIASTKHLSSLINDILDMSKIESGKLQIQKDIIVMKELIHNLAAIMKPLADEKGIDFQYLEDEFPSVSFYSDEKRLKQVLLNILSNGIKYTRPGGFVKLHITMEPMEEALLQLKFVIEDNGVGMSSDFVKKAFEPFEQEKRSYDQIGTGLGLPITKELLDLMGGTISLHSGEGCGTRAVICLKAERIMEEEKKADKFVISRINNFENLDLQGKRALVVEDNEINMQIAKMQLENMGLMVETAEDGEEAVNKFIESQEYYYDIIFMDVMMPKKDGLTAVREIRSLSRGDCRKIPIVAMTANAFAEDIHKSLESGMNYHLSKPFDKISMMEILAREFIEEQ